VARVERAPRKFVLDGVFETLRNQHPGLFPDVFATVLCRSFEHSFAL
jgi:hypothetical protein